MDSGQPRQVLDAALKGRRVLAMLPPATEERADDLVRLLTAAKARWGWRIDMLCQPSDRSAFRELVAPAGTLFTPPKLLKPAAWEADPERVATVDRRLREAEMATRVPVGQLVLAGEGTIGPAFVAPVRNLSSSPLTERLLADNTEPFRIVRRLFQFADEMVEVSATDLLLAYEWEKPWRSTVWFAAASRGIPCVAIRRSKINADHYFWTTDRVLFNIQAREKAIAKRSSGAPLSDAAKAYISAFRKQPTTVKYVAAKWQHVSKKGWLDWHVNWSRGVMKQVLRLVTGRGGTRRKPFFKSLLAYNRRIVLTARHKRFFHSFDDSALERMKYVYFPMHKETDLPLIFQAPRWHDQRNTIQVLASALPSGYSLLVREHRFNMGRRPTGYYRELSWLPNVVLVNAFDSQFKYVRNADLIVTENGSSGWEGLLLGRRVLTLSRSSYDGAGLARKVDDPDQLGATILEALAMPAVPDQAEHDRRLGCVIDAEFETTFLMKGAATSGALDRLAETISVTIPQARPAHDTESPEAIRGHLKVDAPA
jgi:hypothetical protein